MADTPLTIPFVTDKDDTSSGNTPVDNDGDNGFAFSDVFDNLGGILTGSSNLVNAFNGKTNTTIIAPGSAPAAAAAQNMVWIYVVGFVVILLLLFMFFKSKG